MSEVDRICAWVNIAFDPANLRPADHEQHFAGANSLRYLGRVNEIRLDERWRHELPSDLIEETERHMRKSDPLSR
ncbi:MAG: hypothetical protein GY722_05570 [bacterium]|nr:hypothetical protein [bacterium]